MAMANNDDGTCCCCCGSLVETTNDYQIHSGMMKVDPIIVADACQEQGKGLMAQ